jgi:coenzyme F420-reducing hydrogenase gamma subunit
MLRKHASVVIAVGLCVVVAAACIVRTGPPPARRGQPVYVEKHKKQKPVKHKKVKHKKYRD